VSAEKEGKPEDLELSGEDADRVKGGMVPVEGGDSLSSGKGYKGKKKRKKKKSAIGPYQGPH
jgi:hypothetical protein